MTRKQARQIALQALGLGGQILGPVSGGDISLYNAARYLRNCFLFSYGHTYEALCVGASHVLAVYKNTGRVELLGDFGE